MDKILFQVGNGGLGKTIVATAVAKAIKEQYPKARMIVQANYSEVFKGLPLADRFYPQSPAPYFRDIVQDYDVLTTEPYIDLAFRQGKEHLIDVWCRRLGIKPPVEKRGLIVLDEHEKQAADNMIRPIGLDRPVIAFQPFGGIPSSEPGRANDPFGQFQARHLSVVQAQSIVDEIVKQGAAVLQISLPTEPKLKNVLNLGDQTLPARIIFAVLDRCSGVVAIDSFVNHAWAALGKKGGVFLWGYSSPMQYGYAGNSQMTVKLEKCDTPHCNRPETFLSDIDGCGRHWECPHGRECMGFDPKTVADAAIRAVVPATPAEPRKAQVA
jgi:ADP-heptose:LPS heptosyltransferase